MTILLPLFLMILCTLIAAAGALFLKRGAEGFRPHPRHWLHPKHWKRHYAIIIGGILYILSILVYLVLLRYLPLSIAYPMTSISYIWVLLFSARFLGEDIDAWRWGGVFLIILGVVLVTV